MRNHDYILTVRLRFKAIDLVVQRICEKAPLVFLFVDSIFFKVKISVFFSYKLCNDTHTCFICQTEKGKKVATKSDRNKVISVVYTNAQRLTHDIYIYIYISDQWIQFKYGILCFVYLRSSIACEFISISLHAHFNSISFYRMVSFLSHLRHYCIVICKILINNIACVTYAENETIQIKTEKYTNLIVSFFFKGEGCNFINFCKTIHVKSSVCSRNQLISRRAPFILLKPVN